MDFVENVRKLFTYVLRWTAISAQYPSLIGAVCLLSPYTQYGNRFREGHLWIIVFLPFCGYFISYLYDRYGQALMVGTI
ncbi:MAG: hypothetical protein IPN72_22520 [Saprospiraceae bacterium]|nr:hypothetical protein [Saprospiraceae bacterium]